MNKLLPWVATLAVLVVIFGTIYGVAQQAQRSEANYPQIQMAEDTAVVLNSGTSPLQQVPPGSIDISSSLAPFTIIYDHSGNVVGGSGYLDGHVPKAPFRMLSASRSKAYNAITWEPRNGVRIASVTVAAKDYYVLSGRSLTEVEKNESKAFRLSLFGGVVSAIIVAGAFVLSNRSLYTSSVKH